MPHPFISSVILEGRERHLEDIQYFKRIFQKLIVCRNLCKINVKREKELSLPVIVGYRRAIVFQCVVETASHACSTIAEREVEPCRKLAFLIEEQ